MKKRLVYLFTTGWGSIRVVGAVCWVRKRRTAARRCYLQSHRPVRRRHSRVPDLGCGRWTSCHGRFDRTACRNPHGHGSRAITLPGSTSTNPAGLTRRETFEVTSTTALVEFEWITSEVKLRLVDQSRVDIPGSLINLYAIWNSLPNSTLITLPITDETVYPTMTGSFTDGYFLDLFAAINGTPTGSLTRREIFEVTAGSSEVALEWIQVACNIAVLKGNGFLVPGSLIVFPYPFPAVSQGGIIIVPITDDPLPHP